MKDLILILVLLAVIAAAGTYVYRAKKRGMKCIGCPAGGKCSVCDCCQSRVKPEGEQAAGSRSAELPV